MCAPVNYESKKYRILELLHKVSHQRYRLLMQQIPKELCVSVNTWKTWIYIDQDDSRKIPKYQLKRIAGYLNITADQLLNTNQEVQKNQME